MLLDVVEVKVEDNYFLRLVFENGEVRLFNMKPFMNHKPFDRLKSIKLFNCVSIKYGTLLWLGNIDIAPETLYEQS
ncbi:MAG: DUF2442 domain-containing protein [Methylomarinum sp.]|nr:DUF2442 domain-containing protein [Methylomarinum sp.]